MITRQEAEDRVRKGFWIHLTAYVVVVGALAILNLSNNPDKLWVLWVAGGWGIGIAAHALAFFTPARRERMIERTQSRVDRREARQEAREARQEARHHNV